MKALAAGGFRDLTRIASSSPQMWEDICLTNADAIGELMEELETLIRTYRTEVSDRDGAAIYEAFETAGEYRDSLPHKTGSTFGRTHEVFVNIDDKAGAIATIATVLSDAGISIRNIGIIHNREFADGVLRIELSDETDKTQAERLLTQHDYTVVERK